MSPEPTPTTTDAPVIEAHGLVKRYGPRAAVDGLELRVEPGEVFGFLGPNGAGKTTTVRMLLGLARPTAGEGRVLGRPLGDPEARRRVGYLPENVHFPGWFTGMGFLRYHGALYGLPRAVVRERAGEALERLGLAGRGEDHLRAYSHGMLQRLGLAQALLARPRLIFLDEPTSALDPRGRREVRQLLDDLRAEGTTVFLNSHLLSEVERTCDRVAIVSDGKTRYLGPTRPDEGGARELSVRLTDAPADVGALLDGVARVDGRQDGELRLTLSAEDAAPEVARRLLDAGARLHALTPVRRELEDLFLELTGAPAAGGSASARDGGSGKGDAGRGDSGRGEAGGSVRTGDGAAARGNGETGRGNGATRSDGAPAGNGATRGDGATPGEAGADAAATPQDGQDRRRKEVPS